MIIPPSIGSPPYRRASKQTTEKRNADHKLLCTNTDAMLTRSTRDRDVENYDLIIALGKIGGPLKPPRKRVSNG